MFRIIVFDELKTTSSEVCIKNDISGIREFISFTYNANKTSVKIVLQGECLIPFTPLSRTSLNYIKFIPGKQYQIYLMHSDTPHAPLLDLKTINCEEIVLDNSDEYLIETHSRNLPTNNNSHVSDVNFKQAGENLSDSDDSKKSDCDEGILPACSDFNKKMLLAEAKNKELNNPIRFISCMILATILFLYLRFEGVQ
jgi:hypothetical protein